MARQPVRSVEMYANRSVRRVELVLLREGVRVDSVNWTVEEAMKHIKAVQAAIDLVIGRASSGLILPPVN